MPKAKKEIHPLLVALQNPLVQIVSAVGLLLAGVLNLVRQIVPACPLSLPLVPPPNPHAPPLCAPVLGLLVQVLMCS